MPKSIFQSGWVIAIEIIAILSISFFFFISSTMTQNQEVVRVMSAPSAAFLFFFMGFAMVLGIIMGYCMVPLQAPKVLINSAECRVYTPNTQNNMFVKIDVIDGHSLYLCKEPRIQEIGEVTIEK